MSFNQYPFPSYDWQYQGFDYWGIANMSQFLADEMYADGVRVVGRYLYPQQYPNGKGISQAEAQMYLNAGISMFFYYEVNTSDALGGYSRGQQNGQACLAEATAIGVPLGTQIYCCCDTGVSDSDANGVVMDYLEGFMDALPDYNTGIYGSANVMQACYSNFPANLRCQAGAWGAQEFSPIDVRQWLINSNRQALNDNKIRIANITIDSQGYAYWRGNNVDLISTDSLTNMWGSGSPTPPTPPIEDTKMPIWFYLKPF